MGKKRSASGARLAGKELGDRGVTAAQNAFGIRHRHALHGLQQHRLAFGHRRFGGAVERGLQLLHPLAHAKALEQLGGIGQLARQRNAHLGIGQKAVGLAQQATAASAPG
jgi:hypothetical protein